MRFYCFTSGLSGERLPEKFSAVPAAYRLSGNGRLFRRENTFIPAGSLMALDMRDFAGSGVLPAAELVFGECRRLALSGIVLTGTEKAERFALFSFMRALRERIAELRLFVPETLYVPGTTALISSCVMQGAFEKALADAAARYGAENTALMISPVGARIRHTPDGWLLEDADDIRKAEAFTDEKLILRYYAENGAFTLFDDMTCVTEKVKAAQKLGIRDVFFRYTDLLRLSGE